ncbi:murein hydrolase activator EnvC family protein [Roseivirga echinicomitans]
MSVNKLFLALSILFFFIGFEGSAQNQRKTLENQKNEILKKIQQTERILTQTSTQKNSSIGRLRALNEQIQTRSSLIGAIQGEVSLLDKEISENLSIIQAMENDLSQLKKEYGEMIYTTQKTSKGFNEMTFLFASSTFNQLFMRMKYIKQYSEARKKQAEQIQIVQSSIGLQIAEIEAQRKSKQSLLSDELTENNKLEELRGDQRDLINKLTQDEQRIKKELEEQRKAEKQLSERIDAIIEEERKAALLGSVDMSKLTEEFSKEKGKLPWPVDEGFISSKFGEHRHPTIKTITINNLGIDIQTSENAKVKAVFPGKVSQVLSIPGLGNSVLIQHGQYFTVYSKLKTVVVKKGDQVQIGQTLGQVLTDKDNISQVKFRVHDVKGTVNPELWLQKRSK